MNAVEFTTTESEIVIRVDKTRMDTQVLGQLARYFASLVPANDATNEIGTSLVPQRIRAGDLRKLPKEQRDAIMRAQVALVQEYEIIDDDQDVIENYHESR